jgi:hypothetical protein
MALVRIEPIREAQSELYRIEIYYPADAQQPLVTTEPRYKTAAAAENDIMAILATAANTSGGTRAS